MEISKAEASFLLEAIAQKPVHTTVGDAVKGIKLDQTMIDLINKLNEVANAKPETSEEAAKEAEKPAEVEVA